MFFLGPPLAEVGWRKTSPFFFRSRHRWLKYPWTPKNLTTSVVTGYGRYLDTERVFFRLEHWGGFLTFFSGNVPPKKKHKNHGMSHFMSFWHRFSLTHVVVLLWIHFTIQNYLATRCVMCIYHANSLCWSFWLELDNRIYKIKYTCTLHHISMTRTYVQPWLEKNIQWESSATFLGTYMVSTF